MQEPPAALRRLCIVPSYDEDMVLVLPETFLGGSALRLRSLILEALSFTTLPNLILFTSRLVSLRFINVPNTGYISPEVMGISLATLLHSQDLHLRAQGYISKTTTYFFGLVRVEKPTNAQGT
jgi:hypothetical protein